MIFKNALDRKHKKMTINENKFSYVKNLYSLIIY